MQTAAKAYQATAKQTSSPRALEADLLLKAASRLKAVQDGWDKTRSDLDNALLYNRKLWTIFLTSATSTDQRSDATPSEAPRTQVCQRARRSTHRTPRARDGPAHGRPRW